MTSTILWNVIVQIQCKCMHIHLPTHGTLISIFSVFVVLTGVEKISCTEME